METPSQELYKQLCYGPFNPYIVMHTLYLTIFAIQTLFLFFFFLILSIHRAIYSQLCTYCLIHLHVNPLLHTCVNGL